MTSSSHSARRRLFAAAALGAGAALIGRTVANRRAAVAPVAPELRNPILHLPLNLDDRRLAIGRSLLRFGPPPVTGIDIVEQVLPTADNGSVGPRVLSYTRPDREQPSGALLWIHGGGMVMGRPESDQRWCSGLADELGIFVASVDYRLAPEYPFPGALDDCAAALAWLHASSDELGVDPARIAVGGASAGGGLAAGMCQQARDGNGPPICFQLLNYPMLDDRTVLADDHGGRGTFVWTPTSNRFGWSAYLGNHPTEDAAPLYAAPARTTDLSGLPPTWIGVGGLDLFHAEDIDYARRLEAAGVACELLEVPGMYHGADLLAPKAPSMRAYRASMVAALRDVLT